MASSTASPDGSPDAPTGSADGSVPFAERVVAAIRRNERSLWALALLLLALDVALTLYGLERGLTEGNPVARAAMDAVGPALAMVLMKTFSLVVAGACAFALPRRYRGIVPLGLSLPWGVAVLINATLIVLVA